MAFYCKTNERLNPIYYRVFVDNNMFVGYINREIYLQRLLGSRGMKKSTLIQAVSLSSIFEVQLYPNSLRFLEFSMQNKLLCTPRNYSSVMSASYAAQLVRMA